MVASFRLGQIAGLVPPDVEPALVVLDPEIMRRPASTEDLAWMECASSHQPLLGHLVQVDRVTEDLCLD